MPKASWNCICFFAFVLLGSSYANANSPLIDGLAGAGRSGIPKESIFLNPGAIGLVQSSALFYDFTKPHIPDWNAGGRDFSLGVYDASSSVRAGLAYEREATAIVSGGKQSYRDNSTLRMGFATMAGTNWSVGITPRYVTYNDKGAETRFLTGDIGTVFSLVADLRAGLTYENLVDKKPGERPRTLAGGLNYGLGYGISVYGDYGSATNGSQSGDKLWSLGAELSIMGDFALRGGLYQDNILGQRGGAWGLSWVGPRMSLDFSMRTTAHAPMQRDMTLGVTIQL